MLSIDEYLRQACVTISQEEHQLCPQRVCAGVYFSEWSTFFCEQFLHNMRIFRALRSEDCYLMRHNIASDIPLIQNWLPGRPFLFSKWAWLITGAWSLNGACLCPHPPYPRSSILGNTFRSVCVCFTLWSPSACRSGPREQRGSYALIVLLVLRPRTNSKPTS